MYCYRASKTQLRRYGIRVSGPCTFEVDLSNMDRVSDPHIAIKFEGVSTEGSVVSKEGPRPNTMLSGMPVLVEHLARTRFEMIGPGAFWIDATRARAAILPVVTVWFDGPARAVTGESHGGEAA